MKSQSAIVETPSIPNLCRKARSRRKCNRSLKVDDCSLEHLNIEDAPNFNHHWGRNAINFLENSSEVPVVPVESVPCTKNSIFQKQWQITPAVGDRKDTNSSAGTSSHCFNKSVPVSLQKCNNSNSWLFPGIVVWAKKANNEWWPAEVVDATSILKCTGSYSIGRSLVKFFGDDKQHCKSTRIQLLRFLLSVQELILSEKPVKRVRKTRIMRHLGLIAPVGSPFSLSHVTSDAV
ncbi:PWWP domain-containing protein [Carex littledalei]|uniref:PWWP domain-containing protein n=1 Tax=Carex littledalei TaxID=544730 RepID=A0A833QBJ9_9POAL|nr:PWWP domain-containing protein [Carex littledalei]